MRVQAVDPSIGEEPDQVKRGAVPLHVVDRPEKGRLLEELPHADRAVDPGDLLVDDASCADVHVAHLRVPHLAHRQSDILARGVDGGPGIRAEEAVDEGLVRLRDGVDVGILPDPEAVEDDEECFLCHVSVSFQIQGSESAASGGKQRCPPK
jgi:hypothetical protein